MTQNGGRGASTRGDVQFTKAHTQHTTDYVQILTYRAWRQLVRQPMLRRLTLVSLALAAVLAAAFSSRQLISTCVMRACSTHTRAQYMKWHIS